MHISGKFLVTLSRGYDRELFLSFHDVHMIINYILNMDINREVPTFAREYFPTCILLNDNLLCFRKPFGQFFWLFLFLKWQKGIKIPSSDGLNQNIVIKYIQAKHFERFREFFFAIFYVYLISLYKQFWFNPFFWNRSDGNL